VAIGDLNNDGWADLAVANLNSNTVSVLLGGGDGTFGPRTDFGPVPAPCSVVLGDINGDGKRDLVVAAADFVSNTVSVLLGIGDGTFGPKTSFGTGFYPLSVAIGDLNGDGEPDLAVANAESHSISVLLGNGTGAFGPRTDFATSNNPRRVAIGDLNGDDKLDLAVSTPSNTVSVLLGNGNGTFGARTDLTVTGAPSSVAIGDLNDDGNPDLAVTNDNSCTVSLLFNNGDGTFGPKTDYGTGGIASDVLIADLNGDGKPDLAVANRSPGTVSVLFNIGPGTVDVPPAPMVLPRTAVLLAPRPNPSIGSSEIRWVVPSASRLDLTIFDLAGRRVRCLIADAFHEPGLYSVFWDARDDAGDRVREGVYLVKLHAARSSDTRKLIVSH
jgi:hypothetical protein